MAKAKKLLKADIVLTKLGEKITALRKAQGKSQNDLAYECGWDKPNLRKIEKGKTNPTVKSLIKLCNALNVSLSELLDLE